MVEHPRIGFLQVHFAGEKQRVEVIGNRVTVCAEEIAYALLPMDRVGVRKHRSAVVAFHSAQAVQTIGRHAHQISLPCVPNFVVRQLRPVGRSPDFIVKFRRGEIAVFKLFEDSALFVRAEVGPDVETQSIESLDGGCFVEVDDDAAEVKDRNHALRVYRVCRWGEFFLSRGSTRTCPCRLSRPARRCRECCRR